MGKLALLVVGGVGYLLGSRAGKRPYERFNEQAQRLMHDPRVQKVSEQAQQTVKRKADEVADNIASDSGSGSDNSGPTGYRP